MRSSINGQSNSRKAVKTGLILAGGGRTGEQIVSFLDGCGWRMHQVHSDKQAYDYMLKEHLDVIIADIDAPGLGGLAVLTYCHHSDPSTATYAITPANNGYRKKMARDMAGCRGFFYLINGNLDTRRGMTARRQLLCPASNTRSDSVSAGVTGMRTAAADLTECRQEEVDR